MTDAELPGIARQSCLEACARVESQCTGEVCKVSDGPTLEGLVVLMGRVFGITEAEMRGEDPGDPCNYARVIVNHFTPEKKGTVPVTPRLFAKGIRRAVCEMTVMPTPGILDDLMRGKQTPLGYAPEHWFKGS